MNFDEYQRATATTAVYPKLGMYGYREVGWVYPGLKLSGEAGEVSEIIGKMVRDDRLDVVPEKLEKIKKELGDVLWYVSQIATELKLSLDDIATTNIEKLKDRKERGVLHGSGDER